MFRSGQDRFQFRQEELSANALVERCDLGRNHLWTQVLDEFGEDFYILCQSQLAVTPVDLLTDTLLGVRIQYALEFCLFLSS